MSLVVQYSFNCDGPCHENTNPEDCIVSTNPEFAYSRTEAWEYTKKKLGWHRRHFKGGSRMVSKDRHYCPECWRRITERRKQGKPLPS